MNATETTKTVEQGVIDTIIWALGITEPDQGRVVPTARLIEDLGADTTDKMELGTELRKKFGVAISPEQADGFKTVQGVINRITAAKEQQRVIKGVVALMFGVEEEQVAPTTNFFTDLGAVELNLLNLARGLEAPLAVKIPDEDARGFRTVQGVIDYVAELVEQKQQAA